MALYYARFWARCPCAEPGNFSQKDRAPMRVDAKTEMVKAPNYAGLSWHHVLRPRLLQSSQDSSMVEDILRMDGLELYRAAGTEYSTRPTQFPEGDGRERPAATDGRRIKEKHVRCERRGKHHQKMPCSYQKCEVTRANCSTANTYAT